MNSLDVSQKIFFDQTDLDKTRVESIVSDALQGADGGELYMEYTQSEGISMEDGQVKTSSYDIKQGFGLRSVLGEVVAFAHTPDLSEASLKKCAQTAKSVLKGQAGEMQVPSNAQPHHLYTTANPLDKVSFEDKLELLQKIDEYARQKDSRVQHVSSSITGAWKVVHILHADGQHSADVRPLVGLRVSVIMDDNGRRESAGGGRSTRQDYSVILDETAWKAQVDEIIRQATVNLSAIPAPAGEMTVVMGPGWPAILLHEAIGHGLEGDFNRKKTSAFTELMGKKVASDEITIVDNGTIENRRGSLQMDDEGTPTQNTTLIENGTLVSYMQDRQNARLMGMKPTGNGRRESYAHVPMPRMTNTIMMPGQHDKEEIIKSVKEGIYAVNFGGGQVDIVSGKFMFECTEAYKLEDGKIGAPVKGATLIGHGPSALTEVSMVGNDMALDPGAGMCGKNGQGVPVGVGQPTLKVDAITVGGTEA